MGYPAIPAGVLGFCLAASGQTPCLQGRFTSDIFHAELSQGELSLIGRQDAVAAADPAARAYVAVLGRRLVSGLARPHRFEFVVYDDDHPLRVPWYGVLQRNSDVFRSQVRVLPGGVILVPISLFDGAATESKFAAALARGVGHIVLEHFDRFVSMTGVPISRVPPPDTWRLTPPFDRTLIFPRSLEEEADCAAAAILARARYDPDALVRHIRSRAVSFDPSSRRVGEVARWVAMLPGQNYRPEDSREFQLLKERLARRPRPLPAPVVRISL